MGEEQSIDQFKGQSRLPKFATPRRYDLKLKPDLSTCKFTGTLDITVDVVADTRFLVLNAADLTVDNDSICFRVPESSKELSPSEVVLVEEDEILVLGFDDRLPIGDGVLGISFAGTLNDQMRGFYRSTYEYNGEKKNMAVTQFESVDARRCFPCWDEPAFKANFKISLAVPTELVALSNMPVIEEKVDGPVKTLYFEESPVMSTYLVAMVVGLFDYVEAISPDGVTVRVYCQVGKSNQGKFALDVAVRTLDLYKRYFDVPYVLPKLDMVAIPDFAAGAMENYGLVTYRETALLYDDLHSAASGKQSVVITVAHELAHQWFGNLVTMEWWTHLWLNEGFATWMSYLAADSLFPEWNIWIQFLDDNISGFNLDALSESHPIEVDINHASEVDEIFDSISYDKGASVIRMLQSYLGASCFQKSLASYIKKYAYSNAKTEDLWAVLEEESGEPVKMIMNTWTKQKGYPVVYVTVKDNALEFVQSHFLADGSVGDGQWIVPITLCCNSYDNQKKILLKTKSDKLDIGEVIGSPNGNTTLMGKITNIKDGRNWIKFNVDQTGFYRVSYDAGLAAALISAINENQLSAMDRYGLLDDSFALCMACKQTLSSLLLLLNAYRKELEYTVLSHIITVSGKVVYVAADAIPELLGDIKQFFIDLLKFSAEKLGWESRDGESHLDAMLRGELLTALAKFGHDKTLKEAARRFDAFLNDRTTSLLPPDTRQAAYVAVMQGVTMWDKSGYDSLLRIYRETDQSEERERVLRSLGSCPDPDIVLEALNFMLSPEVRNQDVVYGLRTSWGGREIAWAWLKDNWEYISKTWSGSLLSGFISAIVTPFCSEEKAKEVEEFFATRVKPSIARTLKQSLEKVRINSNWVQGIMNDSSLEEVLKGLLPAKQ
ncbi:uncharacterized protein A4U43_C08F5390 [Asparagus officinalis]|uniref:aminopeptidase M1-like n=1 Tax=Asparagus officinalis TaxID=4686 RepID=UPI00098E47F8|nr:aminopeptidase M1-like [Asparagus officinalis]ONK59336.1 uncharacterized protein A4U43_C08F5390 [Asparagus officinalis]